MDDNTQYLKELAEAEKRRKQTEIEQAKAEALRSYQTQEAEARPQFQQQRQTASTQSQLGAKNLAEFWARRGQTNAGITAQAELSRQNTLAGNLSDITTNENTFIKQLQDQTNTTTRNLDYQLQDAYSGIDNDLNTNLYNEKLRQQQVEAQRQQALAEEQRYQQEIAYKQQQDKIKQQQWATEFAYKQQQDALDRRPSGGGGSYTLPSGKTIEQDFKVQNGQPYQLVNGKWMAITYPKDKETGQTLPEYQKLEKWNKAGYQVTNEKSNIPYGDGKDTFSYWMKDGVPYVIIGDLPVPMTSTQDFGKALIQGAEKGIINNNTYNKVLSSLKLNDAQLRGTVEFGNSAKTASKADYFFPSSAGRYQPRYINDIKLKSYTTIDKTGDAIRDAADRLGLGYNSTQNIWQAGDKYYVWIPKGKSGDYADITHYVNLGKK